MRHPIAQLRRNLAAGARLALFAPVDRLQFRFGVAELLALFVLSAVLDFAGDWIRYGPGAYLSLYGAGSEFFAAGLLMLTAALLGLGYRQPALVIALPVVVLAALPAIQITRSLQDAIARWWTGGQRALPALDWFFLAWIVIVLMRSVAVAMAPARRYRWPKVVVGAFALAAPLWLSPLFTPTEPWWRNPAVQGEVDPRFPNPASEAVLVAQATLLDDALSDLEDERPGIADLYFVGMGGVAAEDVFRKDVEAAIEVMEQRWNTKRRTVKLLNNPATSLETPWATVSHLRETLKEIAGAINVEEDVAMLYLASHGEPGSVELSMPPLELAPMTPQILRALLDESGIKWRIVIVSACYSGSFIPALEDENTLVITAAAADRSSFGCGFRSEGTYFGQAFFGEGMSKADSILDAFQRAREAIAAREKAEGASPPSEPQIFVGEAMRQKLKELERGSAGQRAGRLI